jgi:tetratricopeptide (TPR) repeat protein
MPETSLKASNELEMTVRTADDDELPVLERALVRRIQSSPQSAYDHFLLSHAYLRMYSSNPQDMDLLRVASELATQAVELDPESEYGFVAMAEVLEALGQTNKALSVLREGQRRAGGWRTKFTIARLTAERTSPEDTAQTLTDALKMPGSLQRVIAPYLVILAQSSNGSPASIEKRIASWHDDFPLAGFDEAYASLLAEGGDHERAHKSFQMIHKFNPAAQESNTAWLVKPEVLFSDSLLCYRKLNKTKLALQQLKALQNAIRSGKIKKADISRKFPALVDIHLAATHLRLRDYDSAHRIFSEAISKVSDQTPLVEFMFKEYRNASADKQLISLFRSIAESGDIVGQDRNVQLGMIHAFMAEIFSDRIGNQIAAESLYRKAITLEPTRSEYYNGLGLALYRRSEMQAALGEFTKATEIDPGDASARYNEACTLAILGRKDEALLSLREAIQLEPRLSEQARVDKDFASISDSSGFKELIAEDAIEEGISTAFSPDH